MECCEQITAQEFYAPELSRWRSKRDHDVHSFGQRTALISRCKQVWTYGTCNTGIKLSLTRFNVLKTLHIYPLNDCLLLLIHFMPASAAEIESVWSAAGLISTGRTAVISSLPFFQVYMCCNLFKQLFICCLTYGPYNIWLTKSSFFGKLDPASPRQRTPPPPKHFGAYATADPKTNGGHA